MRRAAACLLPALVAACAVNPAPVSFARFEAAARDPCVVARDEDFGEAGPAALQRYVHGLARTHGAAVGLTPRDVTVVFVTGEPKPGPVGVTAGEVACSDRERDAYRIGLYRDALVGRPLATTYHTAAHEFVHALQIHRDRLPCAASDGARERYELEAAALADELAPWCGTQSASRSALSR